MAIWNLLFSFRGRIGRQDFWLLAIIAGGIALCPLVLHRLEFSAAGWVALLLWPVVLALWLSAATRRLHDRDKSAWYLFLFIGVPSVMKMWLAPADKNDFVLVFFSGGTGSFLDIVSLAIGIWMISELGFLRGSARPNKYGPDSSTAAEPKSA